MRKAWSRICADFRVGRVDLWARRPGEVGDHGPYWGGHENVGNGLEVCGAM
jgi:hypothetical protein